jgi:hypothetical protein
MKLKLAACFTLVLATFVSQPLRANELLTNGGLESFSFGAPTSWAYTAGDGPINTQSAVVSPFDGGSSAVLLNDGPAVDFTPWLRQSFTPQTEAIRFQADFSVESLTGKPWFLYLAGNGGSTAFGFSIDDANNSFSLDSLSGVTTIAPLVAGQWYRVEGHADLQTHTLTGTLTPYGSAAIAYSSPFPTYRTTFDQIGIADLFPSSGQSNPNIHLDNFSVLGVPEPSALLLGIVGASLAMLPARRNRHQPW